MVTILPPDCECEGRGKGDPGQVRQEEQARCFVDGIELEPARCHVHPEGGNLQRGQFEVVTPEEYRSPGPVEGELRGVEAEGRGVGPGLVHEEAGVTHPCVERGPDRSEGPVGRPPGGPVQVLIPAPDVVPGDDGPGNGSGKREECSYYAF